jgi:hypothetical protein
MRLVRTQAESASTAERTQSAHYSRDIFGEFGINKFSGSARL